MGLGLEPLSEFKVQSSKFKVEGKDTRVYELSIPQLGTLNLEL
jgi:hypothetical protein